MRVIDATSRRMRHASSGETPSAHVTAALIGDTWLTATTITVVEPLVAERRRPRPATDVAGSRRPAARSRRPCASGRRRRRSRSANGTPFPLAVVDLDQAVVDLDRASRTPPRWARPSRTHGASGLVTHACERRGRQSAAARRSAWTRPASVSVSVGRGRASSPSRFGAVSPWRTNTITRRTLPQPAGAQELVARGPGSSRSNWPTTHQHATSRRAPRAGRPSTPGAASRRGNEAPRNGHQNTSVFVHAPESTEPAEHADRQAQQAPARAAAAARSSRTITSDEQRRR